MKSWKRFEVTFCRWNSNPRPPECESGVVTNTLLCLLLQLLYLQLKNIVRGIFRKTLMGYWSILHMDFSISFFDSTRCNAVIPLRSIKTYRRRANCHISRYMTGCHNIRADAKPRKTTISVVTSVRLSACNISPPPHWKDFNEIWYLNNFRKSAEKFKLIKFGQE